ATGCAHDGCPAAAPEGDDSSSSSASDDAGSDADLGVAQPDLGPVGAPCVYDEDCIDGLACAEGRCAAFGCIDNGDCDDGLQCFDGACGDSECERGEECPEGMGGTEVFVCVEPMQLPRCGSALELRAAVVDRVPPGSTRLAVADLGGSAEVDV